MKNCCNKISKKTKKCKRKDGKEFKLPRKFTKKSCLTTLQRGYSMKNSCAPYKFCKKKHFHFNPNNPKTSFDVYIDKNPKDTIKIKYKTPKDIENTIKKLEKLYKTNKYPHKRIWQVAMIMKVRIGILYKRNKKIPTIHRRNTLATRYYNFLKTRTKMSENDRKNSVFRLTDPY